MVSKSKGLFYVLLPSLAAMELLILLCHLPSCHGDTVAYKSACNATVGECNEIDQDEFLSGLGGMVDANLAANPLDTKRNIVYRALSKDAVGKSTGPGRNVNVRTYPNGCRSNYNCNQPSSKI